VSDIEVKKALRVYQKITTKGVLKDGEYILDGLKAAQSFDGYTASIYTERVRLDLLFHNKFTFTFDNKKERADFLEKLDKLDK